MSRGRCSSFVTNPTSLTAAVLLVHLIICLLLQHQTDKPLTLSSLFLPCRCQKVRREYRKFFRAHAGKKIYDFTIQRIVSAARAHKETSPLDLNAHTKKSTLCVLAFVLFQMQKYFLGLKSDMPSMSPIDKKWPARPYRFLDGAHRELQRIFHLWRVGAAFHLV